MFVEILVDKLRKEVGKQGFDIYPYITKCALDIIWVERVGSKCEQQSGTTACAVK